MYSPYLHPYDLYLDRHPPPLAFELAQASVCCALSPEFCTTRGLYSISSGSEGLLVGTSRGFNWVNEESSRPSSISIGM
jgi:hypothetical protein